MRNSAYIMTGRTVDRRGRVHATSRTGTGSARSRCWASSTRTPSRSKGLEVGEQYLQYLATHPSTAKNIARKLAVRFVCDSPPNGAGATGSPTAYLDNGTAIVPVLRVLFRSRSSGSRPG